MQYVHIPHTMHIAIYVIAQRIMGNVHASTYVYCTYFHILILINNYNLLI